MKNLTLSTFLLLISISSMAANDANIKGNLRSNIQEAMEHHIQKNQISGKYALYDSIKGKVLKLDLTELHSGIVSKGDYYVSCADFVDKQGNKYDVDFMVATADKKLTVFQALVHKDKDGKRKYHLEN